MRFFQVQARYEARRDDCFLLPVATIEFSTHTTREEAEKACAKCNIKFDHDKDFRAEVLAACPRFFTGFSFVVVEV